MLSLFHLTFQVILKKNPNFACHGSMYYIALIWLNCAQLFFKTRMLVNNLILPSYFLLCCDYVCIYSKLEFWIYFLGIKMNIQYLVPIAFKIEIGLVPVKMKAWLWVEILGGHFWLIMWSVKLLREMTRRTSWKI